MKPRALTTGLQRALWKLYVKTTLKGSTEEIVQKRQ
jgi:hypothetical protein